MKRLILKGTQECYVLADWSIVGPGDLRSRFPLMDRIDRLCGPLSGSLWKPKPKDRPRPRRPNRYYRRNASLILEQLFGNQIPHLYSPSSLDPRLEIILQRIYPNKGERLPPKTKEYYFLRAIAKDAGVWPPPKWWRVKRRMLASTKLYSW